MRKIFAFAAVVATLALGSASASAQVITVGSPLTAEFFSGAFDSQPITLTNVLSAEPGAKLTSPVNGRIVRWHVLLAEGGPFYLRVLRPSGPNFVGTGTSEAEAPTSTALQTFPASLPIQAGDAIGLEARGPNASRVGFTVAPGFESNYWEPAIPEGGTSPTPVKLGEIAAFNAEVQPAPSITAVSPGSGSITGGTPVTLTGANFVGVTAVKFGNTPAASFPVESESKLTVIAPATAAPGEVDITVTGLGGTSQVVATDKFKYEACKVPKLQGKKLKAAKKSLTASKCALGKVTRTGKGSAKSAKVVKQGAKPGTLLAPGSKVTVTLRSKAKVPKKG